jgi:hypothetical protein
VYRVIPAISDQDKEVTINHLNKILEEYSGLKEELYNKGSYKVYKNKLENLAFQFTNLLENKKLFEFSRVKHSSNNQ